MLKPSMRTSLAHRLAPGCSTPTVTKRSAVDAAPSTRSTLEKPVAKDVEEARALDAELATFEHPPVMVGAQRRYDPSIRRAKDLIEDGSIGDLAQVVIVARDLPRCRPRSTSRSPVASSRT